MFQFLSNPKNTNKKEYINSQENKNNEKIKQNRNNYLKNISI